MLVLNRKINEQITIGVGGIRVKITVCEIRQDGSPRVKLGFDAPPGVTVHRKEIQDKIDAELRGDPNGEDYA
jgi:carbon storage regulator CsrA